MRERYNNISLLRIFSAICIVIYHIFMMLSPGKGKAIFPGHFGVPIFFFISGFLYQKKEIKSLKDYYKKQTVKIFIPVSILCLVELIGCLIFNIEAANPLNWFGYIQNGVYALGHLWFIPVIFICYLNLPIIQTAFNKQHKKRKLAIAMLIIFSIIELAIYFFFDIQTGLFVFEIGYLFSHYKVFEKLKPNKVLAISGGLAGFGVSMLLYYIARNKIPKTTFFLSTFQCFAERFTTVLIGLTFATVFLVAFDWLNNKATPKFLKICDKYSFYIYLAHHNLMVGSLSLLFVTQHYSLNIFICLVVTIVFTIILELISSKLINLILKRKNN